MEFKMTIETHDVDAPRSIKKRAPTDGAARRAVALSRVKPHWCRRNEKSAERTQIVQRIQEESESLLEEAEETEEANTDLPVPEDENDKTPDLGGIWISCSICQESINEHLLSYHKQQHRALKLLGYKPCEEPTDIQSLNFQKQQAISQIKNSSMYKHREIQKINKAHEILKGMLHSSKAYTSKLVPAINVSSQVFQIKNDELIKAIAVCSDRNISWQKEMEDSFTVLDNYGKRANTCFVGVFDGCNGNSAACTVSDELPVLFLSQLSDSDPSYTMTEEETTFINSFNILFQSQYKEMENIFSTVHEQTTKGNDFGWIHESYAKSFWRMDRILRLGRNENRKVRWSGCTAVTCLIDGISKDNTSEEMNGIQETNEQGTQSSKNRLGMLHTANTGNIHAVLCKNGKSYCLTKKHSTSSFHEKKRVMEKGGSISTNEDWGLVEGFSKMTRGLGFHGDPKLKNSVIPVPHTISIPIYDSSEFLILGSSGLWEPLNEKEVVAIAKEALASFLQGSNSSTQENNDIQHRILENTNEVELPKNNHYDLTNQELPNTLDDNDGASSLPKPINMNEADPSKYDHVSSIQEESNSFNDKDETFTVQQLDYKTTKKVDTSIYNPSSQEALNMVNKDLPSAVLKNTNAVDQSNYDHTNQETTKISNNKNGTPLVSQQYSLSRTSEEDPSKYDRTTSVMKQVSENKLHVDVSNEGYQDATYKEVPNMTDVKDKIPSVLNEYSASETGTESSDRSKIDPKETYKNAAIFICEQLLKAALSAGSQQNVTVCLILLPGCEKLIEQHNEVASDNLTSGKN
ncbi:protein phosphatase 2C-like domain-containing protein 1 [Discoglossus pictus]